MTIIPLINEITNDFNNIIKNNLSLFFKTWSTQLLYNKI